MEKRGQIFSSDLLIGMGILIIMLIIFFNYTKDFTVPEKKGLSIDEDFIFNNLEFGITDPDIRFYGNYKVYEEKYDRFLTTSLLYSVDSNVGVNGRTNGIPDEGPPDEATQKYYVLGNYPMQGFDKMEFCIYFTRINDIGNEIIIPVKAPMTLNPLTGFGYQNLVEPNKQILIEKNSGGMTQCKGPSIEGDAEPTCGDYYTNAVKISRPVLFDYADTTENNIPAKINILFCARETK